jgi:hypothetical protein
MMVASLDFIAREAHKAQASLKPGKASYVFKDIPLFSFRPPDAGQNTRKWMVRYFLGFSRMALINVRVSTSNWSVLL